MYLSILPYLALVHFGTCAYLAIYSERVLGCSPDVRH